MPELAEVEFARKAWSPGLGDVVNQVEVKADDEFLVPTQADILAMAKNDVLEITAGDLVTASYLDEVSRGGRKNRLLTVEMQLSVMSGYRRMGNS